MPLSKGADRGYFAGMSLSHNNMNEKIFFVYFILMRMLVTNIAST